MLTVQQVTSSQSSGNTSETYSLPSTNGNHSTADASLTDPQIQNESPKRSPNSPQRDDYLFEGLTSTPNIVTSSGHTDIASPLQPVCEGSFIGQARHKDGSPLAIVFQVLNL